MKIYKYYVSAANQQKAEAAINTTQKMFSIQHLFLNVCIILALIINVNSVHASQLWNNGNTDGSSTLSWGQFSSVLDDFYVPGAGWWIENAETRGIFLNNGDEVTNVEVSIWPHNMDNDEPDGDTAFTLNVTSFEAIATGNQYFGYDEIMINVVFDKTFLDGQNFYWIAFKVENQYGESSFHFMARKNISHNTARIRLNGSGSSTYPNDNGTDLDYKLYGNEIRTLFNGKPGSYKLGSITKGKRVHTLFLAKASEKTVTRLEPGMYQMEMVKNRPQLYYFDRTGKVKLDFVANTPREPVKFHTPIGDDLCAGAPAILWSYCQSFVACAAYEICN